MRLLSNTRSQPDTVASLRLLIAMDGVGHVELCSTCGPDMSVVDTNEPPEGSIGQFHQIFDDSKSMTLCSSQSLLNGSFACNLVTALCCMYLFHFCCCCCNFTCAFYASAAKSLQILSMLL